MTAQHSDLRDLLAFYAEAGVDEALLDEPVDRFAQGPQATGRAAAEPRGARGEKSAGQAGPPPREPDRTRDAAAAATPESGAYRPSVASVPDGSQAALARELAREAQSLDALREIMAGFDGCNLKATAKNLVFADGNPDAALMLIGEAPGRDEDMEGLPFVGRSGQLLDKMLGAIGLDRTGVYIANVIPWRPPGNRTPTPHETEICRPFIERQIELANPKVIIALGGPSAKLLTGSTEGVLRLRGTWRQHTTPSGAVIATMPTLHPAYLLRNPGHKKLAWRDFLAVKARLATT
jgi:DNA polymerase